MFSLIKANIIPLPLPFHMNLRWRDSVKYFRSYAVLEKLERERDRERERETNNTNLEC